MEATKSLDRKTVAEAIRGKTIKNILFGDATFLPNGQLQPRYVVLKVVDGKNAKFEALPGKARAAGLREVVCRTRHGWLGVSRAKGQCGLSRILLVCRRSNVLWTDMDASIDYYGVLGVLPSAEDVVVRAAYRALSLRYHPDQWRGDPRVAERFMRQLNAAYEVLSNSTLRKQYDQARGHGSHQQYYGDESGAGAGFTGHERAQAEAWQVALEYFPDLEEIFKRLRTTSARLAVSFRAALIETKQFKNRARLSGQKRCDGHSLSRAIL